jgi:hypothetical protein
VADVVGIGPPVHLHLREHGAGVDVLHRGHGGLDVPLAGAVNPGIVLA